MGCWSWESDVDSCCVSLSRSAAGFDSDNDVVLSHSTRAELSETAPLGLWVTTIGTKWLILGELDDKFDDGRGEVRSAQLCSLAGMAYTHHERMA